MSNSTSSVQTIINNNLVDPERVVPHVFEDAINSEIEPQKSYNIRNLVEPEYQEYAHSINLTIRQISNQKVSYDPNFVLLMHPIKVVERVKEYIDYIDYKCENKTATKKQKAIKASLDNPQTKEAMYAEIYKLVLAIGSRMVLFETLQTGQQYFNNNHAFLSVLEFEIGHLERSYKKHLKYVWHKIKSVEKRVDITYDELADSILIRHPFLLGCKLLQLLLTSDYNSFLRETYRLYINGAFLRAAIFDHEMTTYSQNIIKNLKNMADEMYQMDCLTLRSNK